ncbi:FAD-dependent oxidoreductase [candidate division WOR-3 bacterium]|nr:FAD-dependent oxidoreductase [candidate division WOR-3 bacterium]
MLWLLSEIWQVNYGIIGTFSGLFVLYILNIIDSYKGPAINKSPCERKCPAGINIPLYIGLIRDGKYNDAIRIIRDRMPFPSTCGRICYHPCETVCTLRQKENSIAIETLKRAASDMGSYESFQITEPTKKGKTVGIIGAGPAGLSAAYFLSRKNYPVTVYEREKEPGGLLIYGIPEFRLPKDVVQREIDFIRKMGVTIKTAQTIGKDISLSTLQEKHSALIISAGSSKSRGINIPGKELKGIYKAIDILNDTNKGNPRTLSGRVAVIGGGNSAFDAARCAIRCGANEVTVYYRRNQKEMPGNIEEMEMASREGVRIEYLVIPLKFTGKDKVEAIDLIKTELIKQDKKDRSRIRLIEGTNFSVPVDTVIVATGQVPDFSYLSPNIKQKIVTHNTIIVNNLTMETPIAGIFAIGDITDGKKTVVDAIEMGRKTAQGVDCYIRKVGKFRRIFERLSEFDYQPPYKIIRKRSLKGNRVEQNLLDKENAVTSFFEAELGFTEEEAKKEAFRCLQCNKR